VQTGALDVTDGDSQLDAIALASAAEVAPNRWFINGQDFIALRKLKDLQDRYLLESDVTKDVTLPTACSASRSPSRTSST
jgi:HK97 family phage major capsid protein